MTLARGIPAFMISMVPMLAICRLTQARLGLGAALGLGWVGFIAVLLPLSRRLWLPGHPSAPGQEGAGPSAHR